MISQINNIQNEHNILINNYKLNLAKKSSSNYKTTEFFIIIVLLYQQFYLASFYFLILIHYLHFFYSMQILYLLYDDYYYIIFIVSSFYIQIIMNKDQIKKRQIITTQYSENSQKLITLPQQTNPIDKLLTKINGQGKYQKLLFVILCLQWFITGWVLLGGAFFFQIVPFKCQGKSADQCEQFVCSLDLSQWRQFLPVDYPRSIPYEFKTIYMCQYQYIVTIFQSLVYIGSFTGFFIIPFIADNWGRKKGLIISWSLCTVGMILLAAAQNTYMVGVAFFLIGFGANPSITLSYSFINQQTLGKSRQFYGIGVLLSFAVGQSIIGLLFLLLGNWRTIAYIMLGFSVAINAMIFYVKQTPKFLILKNPDQTLRVLNQIADINKRQRLLYEDVHELKHFVSKESENSTASLIDLFKYKSLRSYALVTGLVFFAVQLIYYSITFNLDSFGYNIYYLQIFIGISQALSCVVSELIIAIVKRKIISIFGMGISSLLCFLLIIFHDQSGNKSLQILLVSLLVILRFIVSGFWAIFYVYVGQIFPTRIRSTAYGWVSGLGTIGSTFAPYILYFADVNDFSGWLVPGIIGAVATASIFFLAETFGKSIQDEIEELKNQ